MFALRRSPSRRRSLSGHLHTGCHCLTGGCAGTLNRIVVTLASPDAMARLNNMVDDIMGAAGRGAVPGGSFAGLPTVGAIRPGQNEIPTSRPTLGPRTLPPVPLGAPTQQPTLPVVTGAPSKSPTMELPPSAPIKLAWNMPTQAPTQLFHDLLAMSVPEIMIIVGGVVGGAMVCCGASHIFRGPVP